jgi:hypothetical protein
MKTFLAENKIFGLISSAALYKTKIALDKTFALLSLAPRHSAYQHSA